jgi:hypothetical protein
VRTVPERYPLPTDGQIVEIRSLSCHPGPDGKLIQAKYFGQIRDYIAHGECSVNQLKLRADEGEVEPDGTCPHGCPSLLREAGLI